MQTLVLSGGANYGALQAGAVEILFGETAFRPRIIAGTSAGALNAVFLASDPTLEGIRKLQELWRTVSPKEVGKPNVVTSVRRLASGKESILPSEPLADYLRRSLPQVETFAELERLAGVRTYVTGVSIEDAELRVFGDRPDDRVLDGCMASAAMPPFLPPWEVDGKRYLDGGVYVKLPVKIAIERGATQIVALQITDLKIRLAQRGVMHAIQRANGLMTHWMVETELSQARRMGVPLRVITLVVPPGVPLWDYQQADRLVRMGRTLMRRSLEEEPLRLYHPWELWLQRAGSRIGD